MSNRLVRVKDPETGREFTVGEQHAKNHKLQIIDKPAVDTFGKALAPKSDPLPRNGRPTRADLEKAARDAGLDDAAIKAARTNADLTQAIQAATQNQEG